MILPTHIVAAGGLITNDRGEILLVKNPRKGWEFPGGIVEPGESVPQGLMREIREETGVAVEIVSVVGIYSSLKKKKGYNGVEEIPTIVTIDFACKYLGGELTTSDESVEVKWFSEAEAAAIVYPRQQYRFGKYREHASSVSCAGYYVEPTGELVVAEEYSFGKGRI
jgi:8-oxo-dGTP diphosphatase